MRRTVLDVEFDFIDYQGVMAVLEAWRAEGRREIVSITPPHSVLLCRRDAEVRRAVSEAGLTLPDGIGIILAAWILGYHHRGRVSGPDLLLKVCDWGRSRNFRHYFLGGAPGVADRMAGRLAARLRGLEIAGTYCPPFRKLTPDEDAELVERVNAARPDIVWVGLGSPKQEKWMLAHRGRIRAAAMIGVGAAFDFHSGNVPRAPGWIRRAGLEWAYRLAHEPRRLWRRNLDSPVFLAAVAAQRFLPMKRQRTPRVLNPQRTSSI